MLVDYEALKVRVYIRNLMTKGAGNQLVMDSVISWAQGQPEFFGLSEDAVGTESTTQTKDSAKKIQGLTPSKPVLIF